MYCIVMYCNVITSDHRDSAALPLCTAHLHKHIYHWFVVVRLLCARKCTPFYSWTSADSNLAFCKWACHLAQQAPSRVLVKGASYVHVYLTINNWPCKVKSRRCLCTEPSLMFGASWASDLTQRHSYPKQCCYFDVFVQLYSICRQQQCLCCSIRPHGIWRSRY